MIHCMLLLHSMDIMLILNPFQHFMVGERYIDNFIIN